MDNKKPPTPVGGVSLYIFSERKMHREAYLRSKMIRTELDDELDELEKELDKLDKDNNN